MKEPLKTRTVTGSKKSGPSETNQFSPPVNGLLNSESGPSKNTSQVTISTPKSGTSSGSKRKLGVESPRLSRPVRSTRRQTLRKPSPDLFSSEDDEGDFSPESDDSLILETGSSSSSTAPVSGTASKQRHLELAEMDDSDEERHLVPQKKPRTRKKSAKSSKEERLERQYLRNTGQKYLNSSNREVSARKRRQPHICKRGCHETITDEIGESIFNEYWEQGSHAKRVTYIASRVEICPIKVKKPRLPADHEKSHPKSVSHKYFFHIFGETKQVCKHTFLGTLGETDGFLRMAIKNKTESLSGVTKNDKRGKHTPAHKIKPETVQEVKQHILKYPSYKSHYKRADVGDTRYLPSHLDRKQMHSMYLEEGGTYVSYSTYERIFNTLGRAFKKPLTDTCEKCDSWKEQVKHAPDEETQEKLQQEWNTHLDRAQAAYDFKKKCKLDAESDPSMKVLVFDLEQMHASVKTVQHVFLEAGHTRLEVDSKHSVIERKKSHADKINTPEDWYKLVSNLGASNKDYPNGRFKVIKMKGSFYDFQSMLKGPLVRRTLTTTNDKFVWLSTPLLRYDANSPGKVFFKSNLDEEGYKCLDLKRGGKAGKYSAEHLQNHLKILYNQPLPISASKKNDLLKLLRFLPPSCHEFYKSIETNEAVESDADPDAFESE
ncbi:Fanconi anemia group M protein [Frankliniella fusca]|uniref:Fanconi anemia group M protein n=1 Tax=Frankliniella fusca TaxID=407009 RepID=A0AAE1H6N8_9NEOP|nr:Fanconi anemia group M protein [Frankliniella fusca]